VIRYIPAEGRRALPRRLVAPEAIRIRRRKGVIVIDVAVGAGIDLARRRHLMRAQQRPARNRVVEGRGQKGHGTVTVRAVCRCERRAGRRMRGIIGSLPAAAVVGIQMALRISAISRLDLQSVVVPDMAVGAGIHFACWC